MAEVRMAFKNHVEWQSLGLALGVHYSTLEKIDVRYNGDVEKCKREMIAVWLEQQDDIIGGHLSRTTH